MKRIIIISILLAVILTARSQVNDEKSVIGQYRSITDGHIELASDSTFFYHKEMDLTGSWTRGTWHFYKDTLRLKIIPVYDTVQINEKGIKKDQLILSDDNKAERLKSGDRGYLISGGQNYFAVPTKFYYSYEKLIVVDEKGKLKKWSKRHGLLLKRYKLWFERDKIR